MNAFGEKIKELRTEKGLTQKQLALLLHTTDDSIYSWEKESCQPSIETLKKLCEIFGVSADYLWGFDD